MSINETLNANYITQVGKNINITATTEDLNILARHLEVLKVNNLVANFTIIRKENNIVLTGNIVTNITQECVITLKHIESTLNIKVNKLYTLTNKNKNAHKEIIINLNEEDTEELTNNTIIFKDIIQEELLLNINYYPRINEI